MHYLNCLDKVTNFEESKKILKDKGLVIKEYGDLYLVKYRKDKSDMKNEDVQKCRGIILEKNSNKLLCVPPKKSIDNDYYHNEYKHGDFSENVIFEEFIDGTMINVFKFNNNIYISTRSCLGANCRWNSENTFNILFNECIDFSKFENIDEGYSYSFVIQHPDNTIVKKYVEPQIKLCNITKINSDYSVNIINRNMMQELVDRYNFDIKLPNIYTLKNMEEVYKKIDDLDETEQGIVIKTYGENDDLRSKVRNINYNNIRFLRGNTNNKQYLYFELRKNQKIIEYLEYFPEDKELFDSYRFELYDITTRLFNYYKDLKVHKTVRFLEIDFEFRPLINELHELFLNDKKPTTKQKVIQYLHTLPTARLLFVLNYKKRDNKNKDKNKDKNNTKNTDNNKDNDNNVDIIQNGEKENDDNLNTNTDEESPLTSTNPSYVSYANMTKPTN
jgi:hypothetical protein